MSESLDTDAQIHGVSEHLEAALETDDLEETKFQIRHALQLLDPETDQTNA